MNTQLHTISTIRTPRERILTQPLRAGISRPTNPTLNTLDEILEFTRSYSAEIRQDTKARRIYRSFLALTHNQFEALLAFSLWKVRGLSLSS